MRVLQVVHDFVPETMAGAEINTYKLSVDLRDRYNYEVSVFCRGWNFEHEPYHVRDELFDGLAVRRVDFGRQVRPNSWRRHDRRVDDLLRRTIEETRPQLIHIQHFIYLSTNIVAVAKEYGLPVVVSLRNFWFRCPRGSLLYHDDSLCDRRPGTHCLSCNWPERLGRRRMVIPWRLLNPLLIQSYEQFGTHPLLPPLAAEILPSAATWEEEFREALLLADFLHSPSTFLRDQLVDFGIPAERVSVIENGFRYGPGQAKPKGESRRLRVGMIGMHHLKGLHVLIDAFRGLDREAAELYVYGQAAHRRYIDEQRRKAEGRPIEFRGTFEQDRLYEVFGEFDVLVVPSIWYENCPTVIREAFATGTPVIASDIGGMAEAVQDGVNGLLFRTGDADSLREKLLWAINNRAGLRALAAGIRPPLTVNECTDQIVELYDRALSPSHALRS